jgi:hypothetical protein
MTKITTDFNGSEDVATVQTRLEAIADFWLGSGSLSAATTWGDVRAALNGVADTANQIGNLELASSFIDKLNFLNETDNILDADAASYIIAVQTADTEPLELGVKLAINDFVTGCKSDGIWDAIKASCVMAGARTLAGALVPLKGAAPTNFNFVSGDYNRKTGLVGDGSTKYLNSNRAGSAQGQNNVHASAYVSTRGDTGIFWSTGIAGTTGRNVAFMGGSDILLITTSNQSVLESEETRGPLTAPTFIGTSRAASGSYTKRANQSNVTVTQDSQAPASNDFHIFAHPDGSSASGHRLSFYSIGEAIDLAALDTRVSALMTAIDGAIP